MVLLLLSGPTQNLSLRRKVSWSSSLIPMNPHEPSSIENSDVSPAIPLEISADLAARVDGILQDFAEEAELETALVVERSGALVSGISSEAEVMVEVISALVAGASAAMNSLVKELGSTGNIESFHQSAERAIYLAEVMDRFVLVGVSTVPVPVGVIREKARQVRPALIDLLQGILVAPPLEAPRPRTFSLREMAEASAAERIVESDSVSEAPTAAEESHLPAEEVVAPVGAVEPLSELEPAGGDPGDEASPEEFPEMIFEADETEEAPGEPEPVSGAQPVEPTEVIEFLGDDTPEIVIEDSSGAVIDSPFETEDDDDEEGIDPDDDGSFNESIFELEDDETERELLVEPVGELEDGPLMEPVAGIEIEEEPGAVFEVDEGEVSGPEAASSSVFEVEEESSAEQEDDESSAFELDFDDFEEDEVEEAEEVDTRATEKEIEEGEASSPGPFYF